MSCIMLLVGESGCGKSTIAKKLCEEHGLKQVESYTTRPPRYPGEKGHIFVSEEVFDKLDGIVGFTRFDRHFYCATETQVEDCDIYVIDPAGVDYFMEKYHGKKKVCVVKIEVDLKHRMYRIMDRGDAWEDITRRLKNDEAAFASVKADVVIENYNLNQCVDALWNVFEKENNR